MIQILAHTPPSSPPLRDGVKESKSEGESGEKIKITTTIYRIQIEPFNIVQKAIFHLKNWRGTKNRERERPESEGDGKIVCVRAAREQNEVGRLFSSHPHDGEIDWCLDLCFWIMTWWHTIFDFIWLQFWWFSLSLNFFLRSGRGGAAPLYCSSLSLENEKWMMMTDDGYGFDVNNLKVSLASVVVVWRGSFIQLNDLASWRWQVANEGDDSIKGFCTGFECKTALFSMQNRR